MKLAFIGFGEAARAFRRSISELAPQTAFSAYDILLESVSAAEMKDAMRKAGVSVAASPAEAVAGAQWIVSAVTADQSHVAAQSAAPHLRSGQVYFDVNSVTPARKRESSSLVGEAGAAYVDMAIMAPVAKLGHRTPTLVAGPVAGEIEARLRELEFDFKIVGIEPGLATAIKMVRSIFVKGLEAITVEALLAAEASNCTKEILDSLSKSYPGLGWPQFADYEFERVLRHGKRRDAEMRECALTLTALGLHGPLASAIADIQGFMGNIGRDAPMISDFTDALPGLVGRRREMARSG